MKKILIIIITLILVTTINAQIVNNFRDNSIFHKSVIINEQLYLPNIDTYTSGSSLLLDTLPISTRNILLDTFINRYFSGNYTKMCFGDSTGLVNKIRYRDYDKLLLDTTNFPQCTPGQEIFTMLQFKFSNAIIPDGYYVDSFKVMFSGYDTLNCGGDITTVESPYFALSIGNNLILPDSPFSQEVDNLINPLIVTGDTIGVINAHFDTLTTHIDSLVLSIILPTWAGYQTFYDRIYISYKLNPVVNNLVTIGSKVLKTAYQAPLEADNGIGINLSKISLGNLTRNTLINGNGHDYQIYNTGAINLGAGTNFGINARGINIEANDDNINIIGAEGKDVRLFAGESTTAKEEIERQYEERRKRIQRQQAESQKKLAMFNIAINTAQAIMAAAPKIPLMVAMGIIGAAQLAMTAAQPIPQFYKGTQNAPEGLAWTDEKGAELHTDKNGKIKDLGSKKGARLKKLEKGDKIYTASQTKKILDLYSFNKEYDNIMLTNGIAPSPQVGTTINLDPIRNELISLKNVVANKSEVTIMNNESGTRYYERVNGQRRELVNSVLTMKSRSVR